MVRRSIFLILIFAGIVQACSIPVFRYAIENWNPDSYRVICFYKDSLNTNQNALIGKIKAANTEKGSTCSVSQNCAAPFSVTLIDISNQTAVAPYQAVLKHNTQLPFPWVAVLFPENSKIPVSLWTGELTNLPYHEMFDSKARQNIVKDLNTGKTAVWVLLESGNTAKDIASEKMLKKGLQISHDSIQLPVISESDKERLGVSAESLSIDFSVVKLSRKDKNEQFFIQMLMASEPGMKQFENEPIVFPIYGRGRVLYALSGKGIDINHILEANSFLSGPCACTVKEQNEGHDLLLCADWSKWNAAGKATEQSLPSWSNLDAFVKEKNAGGKPTCHIPSK